MKRSFRSIPLSRIPLPTLSSFPYACAVSICRYPASIAAAETPVSTYKVEVADQSVTTFRDNNGDEYKTIIPKLIVDGKDADSINAALRDHINKNHPLTQNEYGVNGEETRYAWGVRGDIVSIVVIASETFTDDLVDYPVYTKPAVFEGLKVPEVLLSGHHANINKWREEKRKELTNTREE